VKVLAILGNRGAAGQVRKTGAPRLFACRTGRRHPGIIGENMKRARQNPEDSLEVKFSRFSKPKKDTFIVFHSCVTFRLREALGL
jgi:hypothetical protein